MYSSSSYCLDNIKYNKTCYSSKQLKLIAELYNVNSTDKININQKKLNLWKEIKSKLTQCNNEMCWMLFLSPTMNSPFKPLVNPNEELNSENLYKIAKSFENKNFKFYGIGPSDSYKQKLFDKYFSIKKSKTGAFILNLAEEGSKGKHWVLIFIDKLNLFYYDSLGNPPTSNISLFIKKILEIFKINKIEINKIQEQKENTNSCGYYVLNTLKNKLQKNTKLLNKEDFITTTK